MRRPRTDAAQPHPARTFHAAAARAHVGNTSAATGPVGRLERARGWATVVSD